MRPLFTYLIIFPALLLSLAGCSTLKKSKVLFPASFLGMENIASNIYVDPKMDEAQQKALLEETVQAKKQVAAIWGSVSSSPAIYACSTEACFRSLGGGARAHQVANHIVLSPRALTKELISHEWSHAELYERVGGFFNSREIPSWFDEGVAVIVSHEPRHDERAWKKIEEQAIHYPDINELISSHDWSGATKKYQQDINGSELVVTYATAGHIVQQWYEQAGEKGLIDLIKSVRQGDGFDDAYALQQAK